VSTDKWAQRSPERRSQLIGAAIAVMAADGLDSLTTRRVAAHAGMSLGSVHYVFANKAEMIAAVIDYVGDAIAAALTPGGQGEVDRSVDALDRALSGVVRQFWDLVEADGSFQLVQYELTLYCLRRPDERWLAVRQYERYRSIVADTIGAATPPELALPTATVDDLSRQAVAGLDGIILQFLVHGDVDQARHDVAVLTENLRVATRRFYDPDS
jgi:AcrR family transcriptional regulator